MNELKKILFNQINQAHEFSTYNNKAPQVANYPYAVYKIMPIANTEANRDDYMLEISCWDKNEDTDFTRVTQLATDIKQSLEYFRHLNEHYLVVVSRPNIGYVPDSDDLIKRYDVTAMIMTYRR